MRQQQYPRITSPHGLYVYYTYRLITFLYLSFIDLLCWISLCSIHKYVGRYMTVSQHTRPSLTSFWILIQKKKTSKANRRAHELINNLKLNVCTQTAVVNCYSFGIRHLSQPCRLRKPPHTKLY